MSSHLRDDNECQNCGYTVDVAYCSKCGQKNTETRQPFHHLFTHFIEDLVHYDGAFWKTIKHLLFRPARLTKEYLIGKRQTYVAPVKLYIFISFVTFFLLSVLASFENYDELPSKNTSSSNIVKRGNLTFKSYKELEDYQKNASEENKLGYIDYMLGKSILILKEESVSVEERTKAFINMIPKVLFLYMPIFAFWLWLFHGKKRWYFFDHGIFTLHYFSFLLLSLTIFSLLAQASYIISENFGTNLSIILAVILICYMFFYFFRAHSRMYGEKKWMSRLKSFSLFLINSLLIILALLAGLVYALFNIN